MKGNPFGLTAPWSGNEAQPSVSVMQIHKGAWLSSPQGQKALSRSRAGDQRREARRAISRLGSKGQQSIDDRGLAPPPVIYGERLESTECDSMTWGFKGRR
jgi:hypothetical protein